MSEQGSGSVGPRVSSSGAPVLVVGARQAHWIAADAAPERIDHREAGARVRRTPPLLCHAASAMRRLKAKPFPAFDLLELYAFVYPARPAAPTVRGLAEALGLPRPSGAGPFAMAQTMRAIEARLLERLTEARVCDDRDIAAIAFDMGRAGWPWGPAVLAALGEPAPSATAFGLKAWGRLPEWQDYMPETPSDHMPVSADEAEAKLAQLTGDEAEDRPQQRAYARLAAEAFRPRDEEGRPHLVLAEAGTGTGKTLGYIAPASIWAERNGGAVWISTYTKNLQKQLDDELSRLYPDAGVKAGKVVVRKGRENYLCLLNYQEAVKRAGFQAGDVVALGLMARWITATRDGALIGGDFPSWLADLMGRRATVDLTDHRGECVYAACEHYKRCFIERAVRKSRHARIVVANHALVMVQAAMGGDDAFLPTRYVFDEGHHLFDAADSAFSVALSGFEGSELRRWILGRETARRGRARGLRERIGDIVAGREELEELLDEACRAARVLPAEGWRQRLEEGAPNGAFERFLTRIRAQVYARAGGRDGGYALEATVHPPGPELIEEALALEVDLGKLETPLVDLAKKLNTLLDAEAATLETGERVRIDAAQRSLMRRGAAQVRAWREMLLVMEEGAPAHHVDWLSIDRLFGRDHDVGLQRAWVDPMLPFARTVGERAHGMLVTSATLTAGAAPRPKNPDEGDDADGEPQVDWHSALVRTGAQHIDPDAVRASLKSPFDYGRNAKVFVINDVRKTDPAQVAAAYRELFLAAGGGSLGLFTAISRLRAVHERIAAPLDEAGLPLYAQHVDPMDTATLIDIFRAEAESCLLGTDAVRDGVDVPGRSLRLIVFDRVPWPRPDIKHKARRAAFDGAAYDDMLVRLRLKQAFGRLIRRADDHGVFVLLDPALPTRLLSAFPSEVRVERIGLRDAVAQTRAFLGERE